MKSGRAIMMYDDSEKWVNWKQRRKRYEFMSLLENRDTIGMSLKGKLEVHIYRFTATLFWFTKVNESFIDNNQLANEAMKTIG